MESKLRDLLTRLARALAESESDDNADDLIEIFGDIEANRAGVAKQLTEWLEADTA